MIGGCELGPRYVSDAWPLIDMSYRPLADPMNRIGQLKYQSIFNSSRLASIQDLTLFPSSRCYDRLSRIAKREFSKPDQHGRASQQNVLKSFGSQRLGRSSSLSLFMFQGATIFWKYDNPSPSKITDRGEKPRKIRVARGLVDLKVGKAAKGSSGSLDHGKPFLQTYSASILNVIPKHLKNTGANAG
jgi:hypothetical protein